MKTVWQKEINAHHEHFLRLPQRFQKSYTANVCISGKGYTKKSELQCRFESDSNWMLFKKTFISTLVTNILQLVILISSFFIAIDDCHHYNNFYQYITALNLLESSDRICQFVYPVIQ